jgi:hypothetical protein
MEIVEGDDADDTKSVVEFVVVVEVERDETIEDDDEHNSFQIRIPPSFQVSFLDFHNPDSQNHSKEVEEVVIVDVVVPP